MKKLKLLLLAFIVFFGFTLTTHAEEYSTVFKEELHDWDDEFLYEITISSNDFKNEVWLSLEGDTSNISYIDEDYTVCSKYRYNYHLYDKNTHQVLKNIDGEIEILIHYEGLTEGDKYNIYYFDEMGYPSVLDKENFGDKAEVVKINDKLYIRFVTSILKPFGLEKEISNAYKEELAKITTNGMFTFPAVKPTRTGTEGYDFYSLFGIFNNENSDITIWPADEFKLENKIQYMTLEFKDVKDETHIVKYKWQEETIPTYLKDKFKDIEKNIKENTQDLDKIAEGHKGVYFEVADLDYINYLYNKDPKTEEFDNLLGVVNYSNELKSVFKNNNFRYYFDFRAGNNEPFINIAFGYMSIKYNDLIYAMDFETGYYVKQVIYIPNNTKDTDEAYIAAAKKRIAKYLGTDDIKIEIGGTREEVTRNFNLVNEYRNVWKEFYNEKNLSDNYYKITVNGNTGYFVFEKNDKKIKEIEFKTKDLESDVEINTNSGSIPLDTLIEVDVIGKNHKEFKEILETLKKEDGMIYDLKLYSETLRKYITKLDNGKFKVRIPLKKEFQNKKLKAYYIDDNNKIEEYNITIENGYAIFETDHFSTYTIAESREINNPSTLDNLTSYILLGIISSLGLIGTIFYFKKRNN